MGAGAKLQRTQELLDPVTVLEALETCAQSLAVLKDGRVLYANLAFRKAVGMVCSSDLQGRLLTDLVPQNPQNLDWLTEPPRDQGEIETSHPHFQTNERIFQIFCAPSMPRSGSRAVSIAELQATETGRLVSAGIAHDFGNVLTAILLYSDLLVEGLEPDTRLHRHAEAVRKAANTGTSLVKQLTDPLCEEIVEAPPLSWNQVVSDMRTFLIRWVGENIEIQTRLTENLGTVELGAARAMQVILSLVSNARHAMPMGGKITVFTRNTTVRSRNSAQNDQTTRWVELAVTDTGIGMNKKTLAQVFRPFFTTKPSNQGTGLGLTMVQDVVNHAGGKVLIQTTLKKGTRVTVRLPRITGPGTI